MKTMNKIFRMLLMTIALVMGVVNVQAEDIWTGPEKNQGSFTVVLSDAAKQAIDTQTKIQIYCKDKNINYWSLGITVDRDKNHTASLVSNWNGEGYGSQTIGKNNLIDDECIELTLTDDGVEAIIDNGLQIIIEQNITVYKVSLVYSGDPVIPKYTLTYVVDGNTVKTERLVEGATPNPPADPTKPTPPQPVPPQPTKKIRQATLQTKTKMPLSTQEDVDHYLNGLREQLLKLMVDSDGVMIIK